MKQVLLVSFDIIRDGDPVVSLAIGSLLSYLKSSKLYGQQFEIEHISFNMQSMSIPSLETVMASITSKFRIPDFHAIAISCYVWSDHIINPLIKALRTNGFAGKIILGGNQIAYRENIDIHYPDCHFILFGYAEQSLLDAILTDTSQPVILSNPPIFKDLPSPFLDGTISIKQNQPKVRFETKRGCVYKCSFCAHLDMINHKVYPLPEERIHRELLYFRERHIGKINVVDPTFNIGPDYLNILRYIASINLESTMALQARYERILGREGDEFLELCGSLKVILELGIQTIHKNEMDVIGRVTNISMAKTILSKLNKRNIPYEATLIYGIPMQTIASFKASIDFLKSNGCKTIKAFGLMLLRGTELWKLKGTFGCLETPEGKYGIPYVTSSNSFNQEEWEEMRSIAMLLKEAEE